MLYEGPSALDGAPIVVVATGLGARASANDKTGAMIQTWILRADVEPMSAIQSGADASICGSCPHRGEVTNGRNVGRSCYVLAFQAPTMVYRAWKRGRYADATSADVASALLSGRKLRMGSYGDPAAVPAPVWAGAMREVSHWTGYTHSAHKAPALRPWVMASADSYAEARALQRAGWRTFRVLTGQERAGSAEVVCPASDESPAAIRADSLGKARPSCATCGLCKGASTGARSVAISAHGTPGRNARRNVDASRGRRLALARSV